MFFLWVLIGSLVDWIIWVLCDWSVKLLKLLPFLVLILKCSSQLEDCLSVHFHSVFHNKKLMLPFPVFGLGWVIFPRFIFLTLKITTSKRERIKLHSYCSNKILYWHHATVSMHMKRQLCLENVKQKTGLIKLLQVITLFYRLPRLSTWEQKTSIPRELMCIITCERMYPLFCLTLSPKKKEIVPCMTESVKTSSSRPAVQWDSINVRDKRVL